MAVPFPCAGLPALHRGKKDTTSRARQAKVAVLVSSSRSCSWAGRRVAFLRFIHDTDRICPTPTVGRCTGDELPIAIATRTGAKQLSLASWLHMRPIRSIRTWPRSISLWVGELVGHIARALEPTAGSGRHGKMRRTSGGREHRTRSTWPRCLSIMLCFLVP